MTELPPFEVIQPKISLGHHQRAVTVVVSISDVEACLTDHDFLSGFSVQELNLCRGHRRGAHSLAARYAAKRAAEVLCDEHWKTFEITREKDQPPVLRYRNDSEEESLSDRRMSSPEAFSLSLTHDEPLAAAFLAHTCLS